MREPDLIREEEGTGLETRSLSQGSSWSHQQDWGRSSVWARRCKTPAFWEVSKKAAGDVEAESEEVMKM